VRSFTVPYTDHQIDVDTEAGVVMLYLNAWNRDSSGTPDEAYTFAALQADPPLMALLAAMLPGADGDELERLVMAGQ
jgi:hypothetical protein